MAGFPVWHAGGGAAGTDAGITLPRRLHRAVLALLRPAEAAARRLVIIAARGLVVVLPPRKSSQEGSALRIAGSLPTPPKAVARALPLFDPLPRWTQHISHSAVPRISVPGFSAPFPVALPSPHDPIGAARLLLRLEALGSVLDDLPRHARRLACLRAARRQPAASAIAGPVRLKRTWPLRPGRPPGSRPSRRSAHAVHAVLGDLQGLAVWALSDTS
ncbi:hypothetical protein ASD44_07965 [Mesorhizobium sp. Root554]|uniref:hypothetical protein n=1 Tax=unclassified Mesorhizobium TaxID=325217 RepID=UPI0006F69D30|nr:MULTISPECIES: hypothetical protein [unclassified Mesorhizobium]KQZ14018.1 hypothetical protein ASD27_07975 [Mesorhizobium sp. Root1471]KQZ36530.1 hypothetical protein ASD44_07965 [Mesorhizobium sp. Root554]